MRCTDRPCPRERATTWPGSPGGLAGTSCTTPPAAVATSGLASGPIETVNEGMQLSAILNPDGNTIALVGQLRVND